MFQYILRRLALMVLTLFGVSVAIFLLLRIVPGNIADILFDSAGLVDPGEKQQIVQDLGLDLPLVTQYAHWINGLAHGDLGYSYVSEKPVLDEVLPRIPVTAKLAGIALLFAVATGVPFGVLSAVRQNTGLDYILRLISLAALSMPSFWLGLLVLMAFVNWFGILPIYDKAPPTWGAAILMFGVTAATVGFRSYALIMRLPRSSMLEVLRQDYVRTARSKGLSEAGVTFDHALRNAMLPIVNILGMVFSFLLGANVLVEKVFAWPGIGSYAVEALLQSDFAPVQGFVLTMAVLYVALNLMIDMLYGVSDPRVRLEA